MDNIIDSGSLINTTLMLLKSETKHWGFSASMKEEVCTNKALNEFIQSLLTEAKHLKIENAEKYVESLQKDASNNRTIKDILQSFEHNHFHTISITSVLSLRIILDLQIKLLSLNSALIEFTTSFKNPEQCAAAQWIFFSEAWLPSIITAFQKRKILIPLIYPTAIRRIRKVLHRHKLSFIPPRDRQAIKNSLRREGNAAGAEQFLARSLNQDTLTTQKLRIVTEIEENFFKVEREGLLEYLTNHPSTIQAVFTHTLTELSSMPLASQALEEHIDKFLYNLHEKLVYDNFTTLCETLASKDQEHTQASLKQ